MLLNPLKQALARYKHTVRPLYGAFPGEAVRLKAFQDLLARQNPAILTRSCFHPGHVTTSALVVGPARDQVVLTLHRKLKLWLQLGGHADGDPQPFASAIREAHEESGLATLQGLCPRQGLAQADPAPFDIDIHTIPPVGDEPAHQHFDIRYLILAPHAPWEPLVRAPRESSDLRWWPIDEALAMATDDGLKRQLQKLIALKPLWQPTPTLPYSAKETHP